MQLLCSPTDWIWECLENNLCFWKHICCTLLILSPQFAEVDSCVCFFFLNRCIFVFSSLHFPPMTLEEFAICLQYHRKWLENHFIGLELFLEDFCVFFFFFPQLMWRSYLKRTFLQNALNNILATSCLLCAFHFICLEPHFPCIPLKTKSKCQQ